MKLMAHLPMADKSLGQHWLSDQTALETIVAEAGLAKTDTVLEIGPGLGTLTEVLVKYAGHVVAVELDPRLAKALPKRIPTKQLKVVSQDILQYDLSQLPKHYKVVANIPYYLTSHLVRILSETINPPERAVLLVQKEVAERMAARPGTMSLLTVTAQFYWQVSLGIVIPARLFSPSPKVDSQVLVLSCRAEPAFPDVNVAEFFRVVKAGFAQRRKTLLNSLSSGLQLSREVTHELLVHSELDPETRAQSLSLDQWYRLYRQFELRAWPEHSGRADEL